MTWLSRARPLLLMSVSCIRSVSFESFWPSAIRFKKSMPSFWSEASVMILALGSPSADSCVPLDSIFLLKSVNLYFGTPSLPRFAIRLRSMIFFWIRRYGKSLATFLSSFSLRAAIWFDYFKGISFYAFSLGPGTLWRPSSPVGSSPDVPLWRQSIFEFLFFL